MGLFSKLFGRRKQSESLPDHTQPVAKASTLNLELYDKLVHMIVVSETLKAELKINIKQAFEDPKSFYDNQNNFILSERGLTFPGHNLLTPKFVLIDTLIDNNQMAEVDWKEDEEEIRFAVNSIVTAKKYNFKLSDVTIYDHEDTSEILELMDEELKIFGYSLEIIDIDSDSYVLTIVPLSKQEEVSKLFGQLK